MRMLLCLATCSDADAKTITCDEFGVFLARLAIRCVPSLAADPPTLTTSTLCYQDQSRRRMRRCCAKRVVPSYCVSDRARPGGFAKHCIFPARSRRGC